IGLGYIRCDGRWMLVCWVVGFLFFFSSRRRHTRSKRDWSSDVCSSDLDWAPLADLKVGPEAAPIPDDIAARLREVERTAGWATRSEERRVRKECRYRWSPYQ